jgi:hypothetical protein
VMVAIDDTVKPVTEKQGPPRVLAQPQVVRRLVRFDLRSGVAQAIPFGLKAKKISRASIVPREDGTFVVVAQRTNTKNWMAYRLAFGANGRPSTTVIARGRGTLIDGAAYATARGVIVPVANSQGLSFGIVTPSQCIGPAIDLDGDDLELEN